MSILRQDGATRSVLSRLGPPKSLRVYEGIAARTHTDTNPLRYSWGLEKRDAAELQNIVAQLPGKKLTLDHPDDLLSRGATATFIGSVREARLDSDDQGAYAVVILDVTPEGWPAIDAGTYELSLGYTSRLDADGFQRNITSDHLALVLRGRCGETCALRTDDALLTDAIAESDGRFRRDYEALQSPDVAVNPASPDKHSACACQDSKPLADNACGCRIHAKGYPGEVMDPTLQDILNTAAKTAVDVALSNAQSLAGSPAMPAAPSTVNSDSAEAIVMDELKKQLAAAIADAAAEKARADKAEQDLTASTTRADALVIERDEAGRNLKAETARADKAEQDAKAAVEQARTDGLAQRDSLVAERVTMLTNANAVLGASDRSALSNRDLMVAVVKHVDGDDLTEEKRAGYVEATYEGALKRHAKVQGSISEVRTIVAPIRTDSTAPAAVVDTTVGPAAEEAARLEYIRARRDGK